MTTSEIFKTYENGLDKLILDKSLKLILKAQKREAIPLFVARRVLCFKFRLNSDEIDKIMRTLEQRGLITIGKRSIRIVEQTTGDVLYESFWNQVKKMGVK